MLFRIKRFESVIHRKKNGQGIFLVSQGKRSIIQYEVLSVSTRQSDIKHSTYPTDRHLPNHNIDCECNFYRKTV